MAAWFVLRFGDREFIAEGEPDELAPLLHRFLTDPSKVADTVPRRARGRASRVTPRKPAHPLAEVRGVPEPPSIRGTPPLGDADPSAES